MTQQNSASLDKRKINQFYEKMFNDFRNICILSECMRVHACECVCECVCERGLTLRVLSLVNGIMQIRQFFSLPFFIF